MATIERVQTVLTGVAGAPYFSNLYVAGGSDPQAAVDAAGDLWTAFSPFMVNNVSWHVDGIVVSIDSTTGEILGAVAVDGQDGAGTATTDQMASAAQLLVQWRTGVYVSGRETRGRTFVPALADFCATEGVVDATVRDDLDDAVSTWLGGATVQPVIWSRSTGTAADISAATVWDQFAVLRSRRD